VSFLEAKTVKTFIGLVVDVALPLRGDGNDFEDDDAVTRALLERDAIVVIARPPLLVNEPTEVKVVEDDPERSGDIIFFYNSSLSRLDKFARHKEERKKRQSLSLSLSLSLSCNSHKTRNNTPSLSLSVCVCVCPRAYPSPSLSSLVSPTLSLVIMEQNKFKRKRTAWRLFDHEFFFAIFCLGFPTLIMPLKKGHRSPSMCPIIRSRFSALSVRSLVEIERAWYIYYARKCVCVCLVRSFLRIQRRERIIERVVIASLFCCLTGKTSRER